MGWAGNNAGALGAKWVSVSVIQAVTSLRAAGRVPIDDVRLVAGVNDPRLVWDVEPRIPNIDLQPELLAATAVELLLWRMQHALEPKRVMMIAPQLVTAAGAG